MAEPPESSVSSKHATKNSNGLLPQAHVIFLQMSLRYFWCHWPFARHTTKRASCSAESQCVIMRSKQFFIYLLPFNFICLGVQSIDPQNHTLHKGCEVICNTVKAKITFVHSILNKRNNVHFTHSRTQSWVEER